MTAGDSLPDDIYAAAGVALGSNLSRVCLVPAQSKIALCPGPVIFW